MTNIVDADHYRTKRTARNTGGSDGGDMDDVLRRLGNVESQLKVLNTEVSAIKATLPHLATKAEIHAVRADINALEAKMIRWIVGTTIAMASVAFTIAKFVN